MKKILSIIVLTTILSSCLVGPKYERPVMKANTAYSGGDPKIAVSTVVLDSAAIKDSLSLIEWTKVYKDPELTKLIQTVLKSNLDLLAAISRVEEARST